MSEDNKIVSLVEYRGPGLKPDKANPAIPDHVWDRLQDLGDIATQHLHRLLTDPRFPNLSVKEQMSVINSVMNRSYGSVDGAVRRHIHVTADPEDNRGFNALRDLSKRAQRTLPEFRTPHDREVLDVLPNADGDSGSLAENPLDNDTCKLPGKGD